jgi:hypothetical protein
MGNGFRHLRTDNRHLSANLKQARDFPLGDHPASDHQTATSRHFQNDWKVAHRLRLPLKRIPGVSPLPTLTHGMAPVTAAATKVTIAVIGYSNPSANITSLVFFVVLVVHAVSVL